ncbi:MAG: MBL fold metallo-hydrolase [Chitinophagaceae bacterium]|jgi:glyoxylase-like metal-dependent hydrolase (beta-lactamase superfamily II)/rhodanese-related sulfurtransferase|nr:MBL fold metallo-hydrolase [Chitinophagaceae bacterium]
MYIQQIYTGCLSEAAYYIESEKEAAIIDPMRDTEEYLRLANGRGAIVKYIFETHFHADFVSGHLDLSRSTGAPVIYGPGAKTGFPVTEAQDGQVFKIGKLTLQVLHTPGHTPESSCFLLKDEQGKDHAVFTGDTLFVGDVGRPDLAQKDSGLTTSDMAKTLYNSLQTKILPLADDILVYPAHGIGSACGKQIGPEMFSTIGKEKKENYALQSQNSDDFVRAVTEGLPAPPAYFFINAQINKTGYMTLDEILEHGTKPLSLPEFEECINNGATIVDTRNADLFVQGFIPESIFIGLEGRFAEWAGSLLSFDKNIVLIAEEGKEKEAAIRLARVGFSKLQGFLEGGVDTWKKAGKPVDMVIDVEADEVAMDLPFDPNMLVIDVRKETEYADGHIKEAENIPLDTLTDPGNMANINDGDNVYVHCGSGYRSLIAISLYKRQGIHNLRNIRGGWAAIKEVKEIPVERTAEALN